MTTPNTTKSSVAEIRTRFDNDVERFANLETGQSATIDSPLALELVAEAATVSTPHATRLLDIGCGAGNYSLKLLARLPQLEVTLVDLSQPMLARAEERLHDAGCRKVTTIQADVRELDFAANSADIIVAAAVLHHLRTDEEWQSAFANLAATLSPGGSFWIFDLLDTATPALRGMFQRRYGEYLEALGGAEYRDKVFAYIEREDTPRSIVEQLDILRAAGISPLEVLHKNGPFGAFGGLKAVG
jgi:tRNA (cmo5U34)-methyltransferase